MIAPTKLGRLLESDSSVEALIAILRDRGLVTTDASDSDLRATFQRAADEHLAISEDDRSFNSPHERTRVFLDPYLTAKGKAWADPRKSLWLPD